MANVEVQIQETWEGSLTEDLNALLAGELRTKTAKALKSVRDEMREALSEHVTKDVYDAYDPIQYSRRKLDGGLQGQALDATSHAEGSLDGKSYRLYIEFKPNGNHPDEAQWRAEGVSPVHGDDLIGRIENWNPKYSFPPRNKPLPRRPFWQKFVEEMVDNGAIEYYFAAAMRAEGENVIEDGGVIREPNDGAY